MFNNIIKNFLYSNLISFSFPRDDASSPRQFILNKFCPDQLQVFKDCLKEHNGDENQCGKAKKPLLKCSHKAFRQINNDPEYAF